MKRIPAAELLRRHIKYLWFEYVKTHHGNTPRFADCQVRWLDNDESMPVWIKMNTNIRLYDSYMFFNCNGLNDLLRLCEEGGEDFVLVDVFGFYGTFKKMV